ncbi:MAG TPA: SDR family NAD(P)-dependent oxidoreductase [Thermomicrobiales bacterium]|nr:SDR family NAD(P)-dependent oxidoreductase [Thermomicrobiales bacterium]
MATSGDSGKLAGKTALVTGAGSGLGQASAIALAAEGAFVALTELPDRMDRAQETVTTIEQAGGRGLALPLDVTDMPSIDECVANAAKATGRLDIVVNNAGINIPKLAFDVTEQDWDRVLDINLKGVFFVAQAAGRVMRDQDPQGGSIINIASQMGILGYWYRAAYCSSKAGVVNLGRVLAIEWAQYNIRVNAVCPTFVDTPLTKPMFEDPAFREEILSRIPLGRLATPQEIAAGVVYLASPGAAMVDGQALVIDGGWTAI